MSDAGYKWGEDYGKDLLTDLNQLAHAKGTDALHRDGFQRAFVEIERLHSFCLNVAGTLDVVALEVGAHGAVDTQRRINNVAAILRERARRSTPLTQPQAAPET